MRDQVGKLADGYQYEVVFESGASRFYRDAGDEVAVESKLDVARASGGYVTFTGARSSQPSVVGYQENGKDKDGSPIYIPILDKPVQGWGRVRAARVDAIGTVPEHDYDEDRPGNIAQQAATSHFLAARIGLEAANAAMIEKEGAPAEEPAEEPSERVNLDVG